MRAYDWSASPLGPPETWPQSLRTAVRILLNTNHPMFIWWGPRADPVLQRRLSPDHGAGTPSERARPGRSGMLGRNLAHHRSADRAGDERRRRDLAREPARSGDASRQAGAGVLDLRLQPDRRGRRHRRRAGGLPRRHQGLSRRRRVAGARSRTGAGAADRPDRRPRGRSADRLPQSPLAGISADSRAAAGSGQRVPRGLGAAHPSRRSRSHRKEIPRRDRQQGARIHGAIPDHPPERRRDCAGFRSDPPSSATPMAAPCGWSARTATSPNR